MGLIVRISLYLIFSIWAYGQSQGLPTNPLNPDSTLLEKAGGTGLFEPTMFAEGSSQSHAPKPRSIDMDSYYKNKNEDEISLADDLYDSPGKDASVVKRQGVEGAKGGGAEGHRDGAEGHKPGDEGQKAGAVESDDKPANETIMGRALRMG